MLLKALKFVKKPGSILSKSMAGFSSATKLQSQHPELDSELLFPFQKDNTLKALKHMQKTPSLQNKIQPNDLIILDKLSSTPNSTTFRVFDKKKNIFAAQKTLNLGSKLAWEQLNLSLRQSYIRRPSLANVLLYEYDEESNNVKIYTEIQNMILHNYSKYKEMKGVTPSEDMLGLLLWQLLNQQKSMSELGAVCHSLQLEDIFIDQMSGVLKLYDFSGFTIDPKPGVSHSSGENFQRNFERAIHSLTKIIYPNESIRNTEHAYDLIQQFSPELSAKIQEFKIRLELVNKGELSECTNQEILAEIIFNNSTKSLIIDEEFDSHLLNEFTKVIRSKNLTNAQVNESLQTLTKGLTKICQKVEEFHFKKSRENFTEKFNLDKYNLIQNIKRDEYLSQAKVYRVLGNHTKAAEYFAKALNISHEMENMQNQPQHQTSTSSEKLFSSPNLQEVAQKEQIQETIHDDVYIIKRPNGINPDSLGYKILNSTIVELMLRLLALPIQMAIGILTLMIPLFFITGLFYASHKVLKWTGKKENVTVNNSASQSSIPSAKAESNKKDSASSIMLFFAFLFYAIVFMIEGIQNRLLKLLKRTQGEKTGTNDHPENYESNNDEKIQKEMSQEEKENRKTKIKFGLGTLAFSLGLLL